MSSATTTTPPPNLDEYSADTTTIKFERPLPLLRSPIPASPPDNPDSSCPYVLAFKTPQSWAKAYKFCETQIISQCENGARIGCAITASNNCKPPWRRFLGGGIPDLKEREQCEEREMEGCLVVAKEKCVGFAKDKCKNPFRDARIEIGERERVIMEFKRFIGLASVPEMESRSFMVLSLIGSDLIRFGSTNYRASELLGSEAADYESWLNYK
ncbi:uncharacterized protein [Rutidosis leptorrhynchoides]|uniref:uncharacterized protein n=1 Tax=Rutidosis leptorrhynchoides TaxID=125765 RepID=UPI003A997013